MKKFIKTSICGLLVLLTPYLHADNASPISTAHINFYSNQETAFSKGSLGASIGMSSAYIFPGLISPTSRYHLGASDPEATLSSVIRKDSLSMTKGTRYPVDLGFTLARFSPFEFTSAGAHVQATVYESFKLPSLALRLSNTQVFGMKDLEQSNYQFDILSSIALNHLLIFTGNFSFLRATSRVQMIHDSQYSMYRSDDNSSENKSLERYQIISFGIRFLPLAPTVAFSTEFSKILNITDASIFVGKVSVEI